MKKERERVENDCHDKYFKIFIKNGCAEGWFMDI